jgi:hypothetical protein
MAILIMDSIIVFLEKEKKKKHFIKNMIRQFLDDLMNTIG